MISKYITENGKFRQIDEFMPGTWINLTAPTQDESLEIARRYNVGSRRYPGCTGR